MNRVFALSIITSTFLFAGSLFTLRESMPAWAIVSTATAVPETPQPDPPKGWLSELETITPQNWPRLQLLQTFPAEMPMMRSAVTFAPDGKTLVMGSNSASKLFFFDLENGKLARVMEIKGVENAATPFKTIEALADGSFIANADRPYTVYHIDNSGNVLSAWNSIEFAVSPDEKLLAIDSNEGTALVNLANHSTVTTLMNTNGLGFSFSPDSSRIAIDAVTEENASVDIWDVKNRKLVKTLPDKYNVTYSPDGKFLAMLDGNDSSLKIVSSDSFDLITTIADAHSGGLIAPDGSMLVYQTAQGSSIAVDTTNWKPVQAALQGDIYAFSPDGRILISRTGDGGILLWGILEAKG